MGYVPPPRPIGIITLPQGATYSEVAAYREAWHGNLANAYRTLYLGAGSDVSIVQTDSYQRYVWELYGSRGRDLFPYLGYTFLAGLIALIGLVVYAVVR